MVGYPFLPWRHHAAAGGAPARASLPQFVAIRIWILRNAFGPNPADANMARQCSVLTIAFSAAAWSRWLTELAASGLLAKAPFARLRDSDTAMASITLANPTQLDILAADYLVVEPFDIPGVAAIAAVPARGRGRGRGRGRAAVPAVPPAPGPAELRFLDLCKLDKLEDQGQACPMSSLARLCGMLTV